MVDMQLVFLGTSSAAPTVERGLSSIALLRGGEILLFDAGEGMQRNFVKAGLGMNRKMKIFITHMHADHCVGLAWTASDNGTTRKRKEHRHLWRDRDWKSSFEKICASSISGSRLIPLCAR